MLARYDFPVLREIPVLGAVVRVRIV